MTGVAIGILILENDNGETVTVNSEYYYLITDFFWPAIEEQDLDNMPIQPDGATCHYSPSRRGTRRGRLDCYVKSLIYADNPETIDDLEENI